MRALIICLLTLAAACAEPRTFTPEPPTVPVLRMPMNDAYVGSVHASGSLRPTFSWAPSTTDAAGTLTYEIELSRDRDFKVIVLAETVEEPSFQPEQDLNVSRMQPVGDRYYWHVRSCIRKQCTEYTPARYVNVGRTVKDYNGDGYSDLAVGAPYVAGLSTLEGRVYVYFGGPGSTVDPTIDATLGENVERKTNHVFGTRVSWAGDLNGDGFAEVVVAAPERENVPLSGNVYVYFGGASFDDSRTVSQLMRANPGDGFGFDAGGLGDVNGDGYGDLFVMRYDSDNATHYVDVFLGNSTSGIDSKPDSSIPVNAIFFTIAGAGDTNGDGYADLLIGTQHDAGAGFDAGAAALYFGGEGPTFDLTADVSFQGPRGANGRFGIGIAGGGDLNGDGFADFLVSSIKLDAFEEPGTVDVFLGGTTVATAPKVTFGVQGGRDNFGLSLEVVGDTNGDGYDDVLIGAPDTAVIDQNEGRAYLFRGGPTASLSTTAVAAFDGAVANNYYSQVVAGGDFNGDGLRDLVISSNNFDSQRGKVDLFLSSGGSFASTPSTTLLGAATGISFGEAVALHDLRCVLPASS